jgi:VWFA-related protein
MKGRLLVCLWAVVMGAAQDSPPLFHATSELVLLDVSVIHRKTSSSAGLLQPEDFQLFEDNSPQQIGFFSHDQLPLSILLLFDLTDSSRLVLRSLVAGSRTALAGLRPEDEVAVMYYGASARLIDGFTRERQRTVAAIARLSQTEPPREAAFFNEAVYQAAMQLEQSTSPSTRRVVIWFTDNFANAPSPANLRQHAKSLDGRAPHTEVEAIRALHESGVAVAALVKKDRLMLPFYELQMAVEGPARKANPAGDVYKYAELTGGIAMRAGRKVQDRLADMIADLRSRYTIGYRPSEAKPAGTFCRVRVQLSPKAPLREREWAVLSRAGYYRR